MKTNFTKKALLSISAICIGFMASAQCGNDNTPYGNIGSIAPGATATVSCMYGGEYATVAVVSGSTYTFSTCGGSWDSQLTLYSSSGTYLGYNDDFCGLQSQITWAATFTGTVRVMLDRYYCTSFASCMNLNVTRSANPAPANPCNVATTASCNSTYSFSLATGNGQWNPPGPWGTPGNEKVYVFTALTTGVHEINMTHTGGGWVDLFISNGPCGSTGWTYIDDISGTASNFITLNAGQTYYFLVDDENTAASSGTFRIICPNPAPNPCASISNLSCGVASSYTLPAGTGAWNPTGPWGTPGLEKVFSFTPAVSGNYDIDITHSGGYYVDLFYSTGACGPTGWTYVDDILTSATNTLSLTGGVTYLFLIDDEDNNSSTGSITVTCPCIGNTIDEYVALNGNVSLMNNTSGACSDCGLRTSEDITYAVEIPCPGTYTVSTCGGASWDTYLYLSAAPCSGVLASNDDNCGLQSSITYTFASAGTYYVTVEGFSESSGGAYTLNISRSCDLGVSLSADVQGCGYNISCNGGNDGAISSSVSGACGNLNYQWSNGSNGANLSNVGAGAYTLTVSDQWGCTANASATLTEPAPLLVNAGNDQTVYYGYTPQSCADLSGSASGGCAGYDYVWTAGGNLEANGSDVTVCPNTSTTYVLTVTDQNGCSASNSVEVCVIDVICYAGNSGIQKVEMCHYPPGNNGNPQTICIDASAVPAHLAHGCQLGACGEAANCPPTASAKPTGDVVKAAHHEDLLHFDVFPNPFTSGFEVHFMAPDAGNYTIAVYNMQGQMIDQIFTGEVSADELIELDIDAASYQKGSYVVQCQGDEYVQYIKLIKQ
jgi:hypothetical protein